jgi:hypothetical protein
MIAEKREKNYLHYAKENASRKDYPWSAEEFTLESWERSVDTVLETV